MNTKDWDNERTQKAPSKRIIAGQISKNSSTDSIFHLDQLLDQEPDEYDETRWVVEVLDGQVETSNHSPMSPSDRLNNAFIDISDLQIGLDINEQSSKKTVPKLLKIHPFDSK